MQASRFERLLFDPLPLLQNGFVPTEVDIGWRDVLQALVIALMVVVIDERFDLSFEISRQEVFFQQNAVLQGLMPSFHCPAVHCAAMSREGSCLGFVDGTAHHDCVSYLCPVTIQPSRQRHNLSRCH